MSKRIVQLNKVYVKTYCTTEQSVCQKVLYNWTKCMSKSIVQLNKVYVKKYCTTEQSVC